MKRLNDVQMNYHPIIVYDSENRNIGLFDIVVFLGVLYHSPDMIRALRMIRQSCLGTLFLKTHSDNSFCPDVSAARYYRAATLANDHTNFWSSNRLRVLDMLYDTGFDVERDEAWLDRLFVKASVAATQASRQEKMQLGYGLIGRPESQSSAS